MNSHKYLADKGLLEELEKEVSVGRSHDETSPKAEEFGRLEK